jgi:hypothetical protein
MKKQLKETPVEIVPKNAYTKMEYSKAYNISRPTIDKKIEMKLIKAIDINGATIIIG